MKTSVIPTEAVLQRLLKGNKNDSGMSLDEQRIILERLLLHVQKSDGLRQCFRQDDDGHWYMISACDAAKFDRLMGKACAGSLTRKESRQWDKFEPMRLSGGIEGISFTDPLEDPEAEAV